MQLSGAVRRARYRCGSRRTRPRRIALAIAGARVLLSTRLGFRATSPAAEGISARAMRELPIDPHPVVEHVVDRMELSYRGHRPYLRGGHHPLAYLTQRRRLDHFLLEQALNAGAELRDAASVSDISEHGARVDGRRVGCQLLIGADGANGAHGPLARTRRQTHLRRRARGQPRPRAPRPRALAQQSRDRARHDPQAATAGSSPRATTSTSGSAAGRASAQRCASTSKSSASAAGSTTRSSPTCAATDCPREPRAPLSRAAEHCSSATRPDSSIRYGATEYTGPSSAPDSQPAPPSTSSQAKPRDWRTTPTRSSAN